MNGKVFADLCIDLLDCISPRLLIYAFPDHEENYTTVFNALVKAQQYRIDAIWATLSIHLLSQI